MPKTNHEEYEVLKEYYDMGGEWIARDADGLLYYHKERPIKLEHSSDNVWDSHSFPMDTIGDGKKLFHFVKWTDSEPYNIAELIEEYEDSKEYKDSLVIEYFLDKEKEGEETEVKKDLKWFKKELDDIENNTPALHRHDAIWMLDRVHELYNQLDEPETVEQTTRLLESVLKENKRLGKLLEEKHEEWLELMDEINNQETLSEYWIEQKSIDTHVDTLSGEVQMTFRLDDLENLIVPEPEEVNQAYKDGYEKGKQRTFYKGYLEGLTEGERKTNEYFESITEEPSYEQVQKYLSEHGIEVVDKEPETVASVIPNYVAKWISGHRERFDLYPALKRLENNMWNWEDVHEWYRKNTHTFVNAYLTGKYEVEEEQKYYVLSKELSPMLCKSAGTDKKIMESNTQLTINEKGLYKEQYALTEQEIKDYDERYFAFAVKVEELEE